MFRWFRFGRFACFGGFVSLFRVLVHAGLVLHAKGFHATRISYYSNSHSTYHRMRLYTSWDIDINPGPDEYSVCNKRVARNHRAVNCDNCNMWCGVKCASIKPSEYKNYQSLPSFFWWCPIYLYFIVSSSVLRSQKPNFGPFARENCRGLSQVVSVSRSR